MPRERDRPRPIQSGANATEMCLTRSRNFFYSRYAPAVSPNDAQNFVALSYGVDPWQSVGLRIGVAKVLVDRSTSLLPLVRQQLPGQDRYAVDRIGRVFKQNNRVRLTRLWQTLYFIKSNKTRSDTKPA